jgi:hypothetical protein
MDGKISQQRIYCKIRAQLGFPPREIHADLLKVYWSGALNMLQFASGYVVLMMVGSQLNLTLRVGRRVSVLTEKNIATVKMLIEEDAHNFFIILCKR